MEALLRELYEAKRAQAERNYAHGHSFEEFRNHMEGARQERALETQHALDGPTLTLPPSN